MIARRATIWALLATVVALAPASPAEAEFGQIQLVSKGSGGQPADKAGAPALSADGRYLAFEASVGGWEGVFREDLQSGAILRVAGASSYDPEIQMLRATAPSISADGRYISFTTRAQLDPSGDLAPTSQDVYVADMATASPGVLPDYELASALDGCDPASEAECGLTYSGSGTGAEASGRVALSTDGRKVVFVTNAESNLTSGSAGSTPGVPTPPRQVVLRDLAADTSTLVSVERAASGSMTEKPVPGGALLPAGVPLPLLRGAALSADGTTVAWIGSHLPAQVPLTEAEAKRLSEVDAGLTPYDEPLWRRVSDGPSAPTRRMIGEEGGTALFSDLTSKNTEVNSAQGWIGAQNVNGVPRLSADGRTAVLIGNPTEATNLFLVDMATGLTRAQAVRQLTEETVIDEADPAGTINTEKYVARTGHIFDLAMSGDGRRIAFTTARQVFPLAPPNLIGLPPSSQGLVELYVIDRESEALQRVTHGRLGVDEPSINPTSATNPAGAAVAEEGAKSPTLGAEGLVAFGSTAANLVAGDSNEAGDVFTVDDLAQPRAPAFAEIDPGPGSKRRARPWRLTLSAFSLPDGDVRVVAGVPAAGRLRTRVQPEPGGELRARGLTATRTTASGPGRIAIELELPNRLRRLARGREGVYAVARVSFRHRGREPLHGKVQVRFHVHPESKGSRR
jgi:hypothetical protein